jgi:hypothetical protein
VRRVRDVVGHDGGRIVFEGTPADLVAARSTLTALPTRRISESESWFLGRHEELLQGSFHLEPTAVAGVERRRERTTIVMSADSIAPTRVRFAGNGLSPAHHSPSVRSTVVPPP